jgi:hypothetical protein
LSCPDSTGSPRGHTNIQPQESELMNKVTIAVIATLTALSSYAQAQAPASPAPAPAAPMAAPAPAAKAAAPAASSAASKDPIVASRMARRDADAAFSKAQAAARKERDDKVNAAVDAALKDPKNAGKDKMVLRRDTRAQARAATQADFDAAIKAARTERDAARAAAARLAPPKK